jgi:2-keto-4-pentenoate hydratase/2-oxohepta-3-ene-1,7-dioic acid hydratase in catechol pathway
MKLGHRIGADGPELFVEVDGRRFSAGDSLPGNPTLDSLIREGGDWRSRIPTVPTEDRAEEVEATAELMSPLLEPGSIIAIGLNYLDHCREFGTDPPGSPIVFTKLGSSLCGSGQTVEWSRSITSAVDWEAELGVVIGKVASEVGVETALDHVTARDIQKEEAQWVRAKSLDTFCPVGPVVVTADELPDPQSLAIRSRVNGETMQDSSTAEMIFGVAELISRLSASFTLRPGDLIATGTPLGVGGFREPPRFLKNGDLVEAEIEGIGTLANRFAERDDGRSKE